ncbi:MAG: four helix bundle protein [Elusimicrobia bacterium]|nr:four helix bundle protein [Elusimicrobiota bacterium]
MEEKNIVREKTYDFALKIIRFYKDLLEKNEFVLSKQLVRCGTSIGANVEEALAGQSRKDFLSKMSIASKEARECNYWLRLMRDGKYIEGENLQDFIDKSDELIKILTSIVKTTSQSRLQFKIKNSQFKIKNVEEL